MQGRFGRQAIDGKSEDGRATDGQAVSVAVMIDRHLARGRVLYHAPLTADSIPTVRQFLIDTDALALRASHDPAGRLKSVRAALGARLTAALRTT